MRYPILTTLSGVLVVGAFVLGVVEGNERRTELLVEQLKVENAKLKRQNVMLTELVELAFVHRVHDSLKINREIVTASAYTASRKECDSTPHITANNTPSRIGSIAVSRDLEAKGLTLGRLAIVEGLGLVRIEDRMNKKWKEKIDILHASVEAAKMYGMRKVEIIWLN